MIGLLALTMAGFVFFVRSTVAGIQAEGDAQQARLAAESGFEEIVSILREFRHDPTIWYDQPSRFRHQLVHADAYTRQSDPLRQTASRKEYMAAQSNTPNAWRWAACASRLDGPDGSIRFGITPESAKLNLNAASEKQIRDLFEPVLADLGVENTAEIIDSVIDWRDGDSNARENGAESAYYNTLTPPYNAKNNRFDTIEELLLVKGVTAAMLYGEDVNRNGVLDANEDDGDASYPFYDNADGHLNPGIADFVTVLARDVDTALDNKQRINLNTGPAVAAQIAKQFENNELSEETIAFLVGLQQRGIQVSMLRSPAWLLAPGPEETAETLFANPEQDAATSQPTTSQPSGSGGTGGRPAGQQADQGTEDEKEGSKIGDRSQQKEDPKEDGGEQPRGGGRPGRGGQDAVGGEGGSKNPITTDTGGKGPQSGPQTGGGAGGGRGGRGGSGQQQVTPQSVFAALQTSPITLQELPYIMDRFSTRSPQEASQPNERAININTAPARVLAVIPGITAEAIGAIIATRAEQPYEVLKTTAWPLTTGAVDAATYKRIAPYITTKSYQFHVEVIGYADHCKSMKRLEWVIEMIGPMAQVKYHRDLTELGIGFPIDTEQTVTTTGGK